MYYISFYYVDNRRMTVEYDHDTILHLIVDCLSHSNKNILDFYRADF